MCRKQTKFVWGVLETARPLAVFRFLSLMCFEPIWTCTSLFMERQRKMASAWTEFQLETPSLSFYTFILTCTPPPPQPLLIFVLFCWPVFLFTKLFRHSQLDGFWDCVSAELQMWTNNAVVCVPVRTCNGQSVNHSIILTQRMNYLTYASVSQSARRSRLMTDSQTMTNISHNLCTVSGCAELMLFRFNVNLRVFTAVFVVF